MSVSSIRIRGLVCWALLVVLPPSLLGETPSAILHTQGGVWVNGYEAKDSSALFSGDVLDTRVGFTANLTLDGSSVLIQPESVTKFQGDWLELNHGGVAVGTSKSFKVKVNCITVVPVSNEWTQYEVVDVNGTVQVSARKSDVNVQSEAHHKTPADAKAPQAGSGSVHEGEQKSYSESDLCGAPPRTGGGSVLDPKWIAIGAGGAGVLIWLVIHGGGSNNPPPMSASAP